MAPNDPFRRLGGNEWRQSGTRARVRCRLGQYRSIRVGLVPVTHSHENQGIASRIAGPGKSRKASASWNWEPRAQRGNPGDDGPVVASVSGQEDHPRDSHVSLFRVDSTFERLHIVDTGLSLDQGFHTVPHDHGIGASSVAFDRHGAPRSAIADPTPTALESARAAPGAPSHAPVRRPDEASQRIADPGLPPSPRLAQS